MKTITQSIYSLCLIACILFSFSVANSVEIDPYPSVMIPIYKGGYKLHKFFDTSGKTKSIHYHVRSGCPPAEVLEFYDAYFNGTGWRPSFEICQRNWEDLSKEKKSGGSLSRQLFASWEHSELKLKAELWLTYERVVKGGKNEVLVICRLQPKIDK